MTKNIIIGFIAIFLSVTNGYAQESNKNIDMVVATVNNNAITLNELKNRIRLSQLLINKKLSNNEFNSIKTNSIEQLINESLIKEYSKSKNITVKPEELTKAIASIEKNRGIKEGTLLNNLPEALKTSAINQIKHSVLENNIIKSVIAPSIFIPDYQVNNLLKNILKQSSSKEYLISQILINTGNNSQRDLRKMLKIHSQLTQGASFKDLAIAYSEGVNNLKGGQLGWFALDELNFKLANTIKKLRKNEFSKPVKTANSIIIVKVDDIKSIKNIDTTVNNESKYVTFTSNSKNNRLEIEELMENIKGYSDFVEFKNLAKSKYNFTVKENKEWQKHKDVKNPIKDMLENTLPGNFSKINSKNGLSFIYVLDQRIKQSDQVLAIKNRILKNLQVQEAEHKYKQLIEDLKNKAFIELR